LLNSFVPTQDDFPDDGIETEACDRKCTTDADCATRFPEFNECGVCQNWGENPDMECDGTPRPDDSVSIKNAHISLVHSGGTKCITVGNDNELVLAKCGTGSGTGHHSKQRFSYQYKDGSGRIEYRDHSKDQSDAMVRVSPGWCDETHICDMILWWPESDSEAENFEKTTTASASA
jgi:hypothetical protein